MSRIMSHRSYAKPFPVPQRPATPGSAIGSIVSVVSLLRARLVRRYRARLTRKLLEALDDRTLHDIGIERSEIRSVVETRAADHRVHYHHLY